MRGHPVKQNPTKWCDTRLHVYLSRRSRSGVLPPVPDRAVRRGQPWGAKRPGHCSLRRIGGQPNCEGTLRLPASGRSGAGLGGMAKVSEPPLSRRRDCRAKEADRHGPKRYAAKSGSRMVSPRRRRAAGAQVGPNPFGNGTRVERGKPHCPHKDGGRTPRKGAPDGKGVWDVGASESRAVIVRIGVDALPRKGADFRLVLNQEKGAEQLNHCGYLDDGCLWHH